MATITAQRIKDTPSQSEKGLLKSVSQGMESKKISKPLNISWTSIVRKGKEYGPCVNLSRSDGPHNLRDNERAPGYHDNAEGVPSFRGDSADNCWFLTSQNFMGKRQ